MHVLRVPILILALVSVKSAFALTDFCHEGLTDVASILAPGAQFHEQILSNQNVPAVRAVLVEKRALVQAHDSQADLTRSLVARVDHLTNAVTAGEFVFGLDLLSRLNPVAYVTTLNLALNSRAGRTARLLPVLMSRGALIFVSEKFSLQQRLTYLRTMMNHPEASAEFLKIANAGQWINATLSAPGLSDLVGPGDLTTLCSFASAVVTQELSHLSSGAADHVLGVEQWKMALTLARQTQTLMRVTTGPCERRLADSVTALLRLGQSHQFTP